MVSGRVFSIRGMGVSSRLLFGLFHVSEPHLLTGTIPELNFLLEGHHFLIFTSFTSFATRQGGRPADVIALAMATFFDRLDLTMVPLLLRTSTVYPMKVH